WVVAAVRRTEEKWGHRPNYVLTWIPKLYHSKLFFRLGQIDAPEARAWHQRLGKQLRHPGYMLLVVAVALGLLALGFAVLATVMVQHPGDDFEYPRNLGVFLGLASMVLLLCGGAVVRRFRDRSSED